jgi:hypothetical protein
MGSFRFTVCLIMILTVYSNIEAYPAVLDGLFKYDLHFFEVNETYRFKQALLNFALNPNKLRKKIFQQYL